MRLLANAADMDGESNTMADDMTDDIRVQLAKKLGWKYREPRPPWAGYWTDPDGNPSGLPSLYDLVQQGEERLTEEQQAKYAKLLTVRVDFDDLYEYELVADYKQLFNSLRLSNLPERAKALCEVLP